MKNVITRVRQLILIVGDIALLYGALYLTLILRYGQITDQILNDHLIPFSILYLAWLIIFYSQGFYDLSLAKNNVDFWSSLLKATIFNAGLGIMFFYFVPIFKITPKTNFIINTFAFSFLFIIWRQLFNMLLQQKTFRQNILFIGNNDDVKNIIDKIKTNPQFGFNVKMQINPENIKNAIDLMNIINKQNIRTIVVADNPYGNQRLAQILFQCLPLQISIYDLPIFYEKITGRVPINAINQIWFLENLVESEREIYETSKRILDIIIAGFFSIGLIIVYPFIAILVKLSSSGPIFYSQTRVGKNERMFKLTKFRSMVQDAEKGKALWTTKDDPRITGMGKFLRRSFLDELPQLLSILKGEMSFIGPRPERPEFVAELEKLIPYYQIRHLVKPGLTGWAQINFRYGSSVDDSMQKLQYDLYYIKNRSIILDVSIILKTIKLIFKERSN